jgi:hypothetical protein
MHAFVSTNLLNINISNNVNTINDYAFYSCSNLTSITANVNYSNLIVNYTGSTNIPAGIYKVYTTKPSNGMNITNSGGNLYWQGGNLI